MSYAGLVADEVNLFTHLCLPFVFAYDSSRLEESLLCCFTSHPTICPLAISVMHRVFHSFIGSHPPDSTSAITATVFSLIFEEAFSLPLLCLGLLLKPQIRSHRVLCTLDL